MMNKSFACPCCGFKTFSEKPNGSFEICPVCFWEDDPIQLADLNNSGGANRVSLLEGQRNFLKFGACEERFLINVRLPLITESRDKDWKPFDQKNGP